MKIEEWIVLGHSFGGIMANYYSAQHPSHVKAMISSSSGGIDLALLGNAQFILNLIHWLNDVEGYSGPLIEISDSTTEYNVIIQANKEMENAYHANDFKKVASFYADDAVMVGNRHQVEGRASIDNYWLGLKDRGISWKLENVHLEVQNTVAIQRGISRMKFLHDGSEHLSEVRFTLVWKKINGEWRIELDHYSLL